MDLSSYIRNVNNFPKPGIVFKDITPLLKDPKAVNQAVAQLYHLTEKKNVDLVVGIESRGFFFGTLLAQKLNCGFVPVRKPNKLPYATVSETYALEYGNDTLEIHKDAIQKGDKVIVHDDVLATGGTALAVCKLVEKLGGEVVQCNFLMELSFLEGRKKLSGHNVQTIIKY
ncbi:MULTISPECIES: adenine phosphoribosyltransferase [Galbibacter]|uniref:Adenine phosphoribosyltransferase n=1 Tax=Galbibacter pacificus TaxID=2996052 RepID=A0ABT6FV65_9FLAO|nr:adenine phosphoribosyltransferase [Galbibacter pacificus]MDG3583924.1 adenine phosphoribosyltransferase [Galbibacter pacificus]MDG3587158.1 adenine phosphoribosyltransferase [Galbibacter pacificus]